MPFRHIAVIGYGRSYFKDGIGQTRSADSRRHVLPRDLLHPRGKHLVVTHILELALEDCAISGMMLAMRSDMEVNFVKGVTYAGALGDRRNA
jgi:hypothetical protein